MAMEMKRGEGEPMMEINMTPLIDVMLVLLTLLIITLPIQTHAVKLDMPQGRPNNGPIFTPVNLAIDFDGTILWNGSVVDRETLDAYFLNAAQAEPQPEIHLNPNKLTKYDIVAKVLADAQRLGVKKIGFTGLDQYMQ